MDTDKLEELIRLCEKKHKGSVTVTFTTKGYRSYISNGIETLYGHLEHDSLEEVAQRLENHLAIDDLHTATKESIRELIAEERGNLEYIKDKIEGLELKLQMLE